MLQEDRTLLAALEALLEEAVGPGRSWAAAMDSGLVNNLGEAPAACANGSCANAHCRKGRKGRMEVGLGRS